MIKRLFSIGLCLVAILLFANIQTVIAKETNHSYTKAMGDSAYIKGDYAKAISVYEAILKDKEAPELYYNVGNAYYKSNNLGKAILNYERAFLMNPGNDNINNNLSLARQKTVDKVIPNSQIFFVKWIDSFSNMFNLKMWAIFAVTSFVLFLICAYIYLFSKSISLKKISFFAGIAFLIISVISNLFGMKQYRMINSREYGIIMPKSIDVSSTPSNTGTVLFKIHEGHKVKVIDSSMKDWYEIQLEDGKVGWVDKESLEII